MTPDQICETYADGNTKINISVENDFILIEGDKTALEFLGNLLLAQAAFQKDSGFQIFPDGPGNVLFSKESTHGIYIHRKD